MYSYELCVQQPAFLRSLDDGLTESAGGPAAGADDEPTAVIQANCVSRLGRRRERVDSAMAEVKHTGDSTNDRSVSATRPARAASQHAF